jgi:hypothetical protein
MAAQAEEEKVKVGLHPAPSGGRGPTNPESQAPRKNSMTEELLHSFCVRRHAISMICPSVETQRLPFTPTGERKITQTEKWKRI